MTRHLLVPGLLGPPPKASDASVLPRLPAIEMLLARADRERGPGDYAHAACALFGIDAPPGADLPTAALTYAHQTARSPTRWVMHADPVHLRPDQDRLILFDSARLAITAAEAAAFAAAFNGHFAGEGLELVAPRPDRWYLLADREPGINTAPLDAVAGRNIDRFLPTGERQRDWRGLLNEVQMLFHGLPTNREREARGAPAVSGLWLSGGGLMPRRGSTAIAAIHGDELLVSALAARAEVHGDDSLHVERRPWRALLDADPDAWVKALVAFDAVLAPLLEAPGPLTLLNCSGHRYHWRRGMRRRFWRRLLPLGAQLAHAED